MITSSELRNSLWGAWRLALRDPSGLMFFDTTIGGFWRSFWAMAVAAPGWIILVLADERPDIVLSGFGYFTVELLAYVTTWLATPVAMEMVLRAIGREALFITYVVASNWAAAIGITLTALGVVIGGLDFLPFDGNLVEFVVAVWLLIYSWFVIKVSLEASPRLILGVIGIDLLLSLLISSAALHIEMAG